MGVHSFLLFPWVEEVGREGNGGGGGGGGVRRGGDGFVGWADAGAWILVSMTEREICLSGDAGRKLKNNVLKIGFLSFCSTFLLLRVYMTANEYQRKGQ